MFTTLKPWGKWGPSPPFREWVITCMLFPMSRVFIWLCIILDKKSIHFLFLCCFDCLVQVGWVHSLVCDSFPLNWKFCLPISQHLGYPQSIKGNWPLINFAFLDHVDDPIDGGCTQINWYLGPKASRAWYDKGYLIFIVAQNTFHLNPDDKVTQGPGEKSSQTIYTQDTTGQVA